MTKLIWESTYKGQSICFSFKHITNLLSLACLEKGIYHHVLQPWREFLIDVIKNYVDLGSLSLENQTSWSSRSALPKVTGPNVELNLGLPKQTSELGFTLLLRIRALRSDVFSTAGVTDTYRKWIPPPHIQCILRFRRYRFCVATLGNGSHSKAR